MRAEAIDGVSLAFGVEWAGVEVVKPRNSSLMLFTSPATAPADTIDVITGPQAEVGFAKNILTNKGDKPTFVTVLTEDWLEPAGRIMDIIELDYDPETGVALYGAFLEY